MALETISQILSPTNATYINGVSAERRFSPAVLKNIYQGLVEKSNKGVNDKFVSSDDAESSAQVFVNRVLPVKMKPREQGASKNGASFSGNSHTVQTVTVGIEILTVLDDPIIIPRARQDMIKVDLLAEQTQIYSDRARTIINGMTAASKLFRVWEDKADGKEVNEKNISATDITNKQVLLRFEEANDLLDEGDSENGVDIFPDDTRVFVIKTASRSLLKSAGVLVIGGANYAYDIAKGGAVSQGDTARKSEDGFIGTVDGVDVHVISNESLAHASEFLGFDALSLKKSTFLGYLASSWANARGVSTTKTVKIIDAHGGQGLEVQPYTKMGAVSWYAKGTVLLTNGGALDPFTGLKALAPSAVRKLKASGSRLYPVVPANAFSGVSTSGFTFSGATALDDFNGDHVSKIYWAYDKGYDSVIAALQDYANLTEYTTAVSGQSFTAGKKVQVLVISDDGSCTLAETTIPA